MLTIEDLEVDVLGPTGDGRDLGLRQQGSDLLGHAGIQLLGVGDVEEHDQLALVEGVLVGGHPLALDHLDVRLLHHLGEGREITSTGSGGISIVVIVVKYVS